jgi:hypothetical protein
MEPVGPGGTDRGEQPSARRAAPLRRLWYVLLLLEFPAVLVPSFYARQTPQLWGIPFFYWYQLLWVIIAAVLTAVVYVATTNGNGKARPSSVRMPEEVSR